MTPSRKPPLAPKRFLALVSSAVYTCARLDLSATMLLSNVAEFNYLPSLPPQTLPSVLFRYVILRFRTRVNVLFRIFLFMEEWIVIVFDRDFAARKIEFGNWRI